jgi:hypothetical protein
MQPHARWMMAERKRVVWYRRVPPCKLSRSDGQMFPFFEHGAEGKTVVPEQFDRLRYAIMLSAKPVLPDEAPFPSHS